MRYACAMAKELPHPGTEQISLSDLFDALSDPLRRIMVARLAREGECTCSSFLPLGSKTNLSYHLARMRQAGLTRTRMEGTTRLVSLRTADLEARFPGLLDAVLSSVAAEESAARPATRPVRPIGTPAGATRRTSAKGSAGSRKERKKAVPAKAAKSAAARAGPTRVARRRAG